jgi:hypothetical protein
MLVPAMKSSVIEYFTTYLVKGGSCYNRYKLCDAVAKKAVDFFLHLISIGLLPCTQFFIGINLFLNRFITDIKQGNPNLDIIFKYHG